MIVFRCNMSLHLYNTILPFHRQESSLVVEIQATIGRITDLKKDVNSLPIQSTADFVEKMFGLACCAHVALVM